MEYTHTFEIETAKTGIIEGEMSFNGVNNLPPRIAITEPVNVTLEEYKEIGILLKEVVNVYKCSGVIEKIEIVKKPIEV